MTPAVLARLALMAAAFALMAPVQLLLIRRSGRRAGLLPLLFHRLFLRLFAIRVETRGVAPSGPALIVANHVSWLDIAVLGACASLSFVAKSEVAGWPVIRTFARLQRTLFVDRSRRSATAEVNAAIAARLASGDAMVLFAEGTTGDGLKVLPFRSALLGAIGKAGRADAPSITVQPLALAYRRRNGLPLSRRERPRIAWYGDMDLAPHLAALLRAGPLDVVVEWCAPIETTGTDRKRIAALCEVAVRDAVQRFRRG